MRKKSLLSTLLPLLFLGIITPSGNAQEIDPSIQKHIATQTRNNIINKELPSMLSIDDSTTYSRRLEQEYGIAPASDLYGDVWVNRWVNPYRRAGIQLPDTFAINVANYCMPITGRITSDYGFRRYRMHRGVDIKLAIGDTIRAAFAGQDKERKAAIEALNAAEAALYRVNTALGSKAGKELDRDTRGKIKDAERNLEKATRHKKAEKMTPAEVQAVNAAREALAALATPLVTRWESEK